MNAEAFWVNVDKPTKRVTIHCSTCQSMGTRQKNRANGGWTPFPTYQEAFEFAVRQRNGLTHNCTNCRPEL